MNIGKNWDINILFELLELGKKGLRRFMFLKIMQVLQ